MANCNTWSTLFFLATCGSLALLIIGIGSPNWYEATANLFLTTSSTTYGLWRTCVTVPLARVTTCRNQELDPRDVSSWITTVRALMLLCLFLVAIPAIASVINLFKGLGKGLVGMMGCLIIGSIFGLAGASYFVDQSEYGTITTSTAGFGLYLSFVGAILALLAAVFAYFSSNSHT